MSHIKQKRDPNSTEMHTGASKQTNLDAKRLDGTSWKANKNNSEEGLKHPILSPAFHDVPSRRSAPRFVYL